MANYKAYTDQDIIDASASNFSMASVLKALNLKPVGGNYVQLKKNLQRLNIDTSHWTGQGWNKDQQLKDWSEYSSSASLKVQLIKAKGNACENCGLKKWEGQNITIELHHVDGDRSNNVLENLQLLCPNCHSMTDTWRKKHSSR